MSPIVVVIGISGRGQQLLCRVDNAATHILVQRYTPQLLRNYLSLVKRTLYTTELLQYRLN
jgi:hypothetical protein